VIEEPARQHVGAVGAGDVGQIVGPGQGIQLSPDSVLVGDERHVPLDVAHDVPRRCRTGRDDHHAPGHRREKLPPGSCGHRRLRISYRPIGGHAAEAPGRFPDSDCLTARVDPG